MIRPSLRSVRPFALRAASARSIFVPSRAARITSSPVPQKLASSDSPVASAVRSLSTGGRPTRKKGSWKWTLVNWGLAGYLIYLLEPLYPDNTLREPEWEPDERTIDAIVNEKRKKLAAEAAHAESKTQSKPESTSPSPSPSQSQPSSPDEHEPHPAEALAEEASQQGAYNPETGEINWDCPCLGGMASGPCGEEFKAAFSCFVYSTEEPKGMDCIDKFQGMQDCFRKYPEVYGPEYDDEEGSSDASASSPPADSPSAAESEEKPVEPKTSTSIKDNAVAAVEPIVNEVKVDAQKAKASVENAVEKTVEKVTKN